MIRIVMALAAGLVLGSFFGKSVAWGPELSEISKAVIQLIKAIALPLLFFAVVNALVHTQVKFRHGRKMLLVAFTNATIALFIGIGISHWIRPGDSLREAWSKVGLSNAKTLPDLPEFNILKTLGSWLPKSIAQPFFDNSVIPAVVLALFLGLALRSEVGESLLLKRILEAGQRVCEKILFWVTRLIPFAVFAAVFSSVSAHGFQPLLALFPYLWVGLLGLAIHILLTYQGWIIFLKKIPLGAFWREAKVPVFQALGTNSSLASLPFTLQSLDRLGVSKRASALGACVGTNLNNDGIILYEGMAFLFAAQASGLDLTLGQQLAGAGLCMITAVGIAGVPEAGFISLALVLTNLGIPTENLALLLSVDWLLGRARSVTNVLSDMIVSIAIDESEGDS